MPGTQVQNLRCYVNRGQPGIPVGIGVRLTGTTTRVDVGVDDLCKRVPKSQCSQLTAQPRKHRDRFAFDFGK